MRFSATNAGGAQEAGSKPYEFLRITKIKCSFLILGDSDEIEWVNWAGRANVRLDTLSAAVHSLEELSKDTKERIHILVKNNEIVSGSILRP